MYKNIRSFVAVLAVLAITLSGGIANAHSLKQDNGYSAVLHIAPDDNPSANEPNVINFLIDKQKGGFNQNYFDIKLDISTNGKLLKRAVVEPAVFGNAADGLVNYIFPSVNVYTLDLHGVSKTDSSDKFHMTFIVRVADTAGSAAATSNKGSQVVILGAGSFVVLGFAAFVGIRQGKRYAPKPQPAVVKAKRSSKKK